MFRDSYKELNAVKIENLIEILNPLLSVSPFEASKTKALSHPLPFYPATQFIEIRKTDINPIFKLNILLPLDDKKWAADDIYILDGTNKPFYALNKKLPINLTIENVTIYVQLFFEYVRGAHGKFQILNSFDDIEWQEQPAPAAKKALAKMIAPLSIIEEDQDQFLLKSSIIFKDSLFESDVLVTKEGLITLSNQKILVEDLPVIDSNLV